MKFIHTADLHIDSPMKTCLKQENIKKRQEELLENFSRLAQYASDNNVKAIIIAGDMFDNSKKIKVKTKKRILDIINKFSDVDFLYLKGNHDEDTFADDIEIPKNLKFFGKEWEYYNYENTVIAGVEIGFKNILKQLELDYNNFNIVVLHGQIDKTKNPKDKEEIIYLSDLVNQNIDYLALGHIHKGEEGKLDTRGIYAYSGCLEGRSFDECGQKGFIELEITDNKLTKKFVPFAKRTIHQIEIDVTNINTELDLIEAIKIKIKDIKKEDYVRIVLVGSINVDNKGQGLETLLNTDDLQSKFEDDYYVFAVKDETKTIINYKNFEHDISLKGEFVRNVEQDTSLTEEEKEKICRLGIMAIFGGEI